MSVPNVVDLYHGDSVKSFQQARDAGVLGVIHKATTGGTGRDDAYDDRSKAALEVGLLWGAYHWGTSAPAKTQVENFLSWAKPNDKTLVALDFERTAGNQMTLDGAREFLTLIQQRLGRKAVLYGGSLLKEMLGTRKDTFFGGHRLWLAEYGNHPTVQASWDRFWLWQYTDGSKAGPEPKTVPGLPGDSKGQLDCDHFVGTAQQLADEWAE